VAHDDPIELRQGLLDGMAYRQWASKDLPPNEVASLLRDVLEKMPHRQRNLIYAYYYERLSYQQIAARNGWAGRGSAKWAVDKALTMLKRRLERRIHHVTAQG
jgi:DNA-directed RNA polymerase specialized sigma24 family protein